MVNLNMPPGMTENERATWLEAIGQALVRETGQPSGVTEQQPGDHGQPVWGVWWSKD
jgi:hypothetical protein